MNKGDELRRGALRTVGISCCSRTEDVKGDDDERDAFLFVRTNRTRPTELNVFLTVNEFFLFILSAER